jgi:hypothetical protein
MSNRILAASRTTFALCRIVTILFIGVLSTVARSQPPEQEPAEETPEAEIEPTPLPRTEIGNVRASTVELSRENFVGAQRTAAPGNRRAIGGPRIVEQALDFCPRRGPG